jgi:SPP1 gp7 family putative phage head morphogenesis protein
LFAEWSKYDDELAKALKPLYFNIITTTGYSAMAELAYNGAQVPTFDPYKKNIQNWFNSKAEKVGGDVNAETEKQLRATLAEGISANESTYELRARIENTLGYASTRRADNIARTESARAQTYADIAAWEQSGVVVEKRWYTARDERVCQYCAYMDGTVVEVSKNYFDKGDELTVDYTTNAGKQTTGTINFNYDSVKGAPLHSSCRCVLIPILSKI